MRYIKENDLLLPRAIDPSAFALPQTGCIFEYDSEIGFSTATPGFGQNAACNKQWAPVNGTFTTPIRDYSVTNGATSMTYGPNAQWRGRPVYYNPNINHIPWTWGGALVAQKPVLPAASVGVTLMFVAKAGAVVNIASDTVAGGEKQYSFQLSQASIRWGNAAGATVTQTSIPAVLGEYGFVVAASITEAGVIMVATGERYHARKWNWTPSTFGRGTAWSSSFGSSPYNNGIWFQNTGDLCHLSMYDNAMTQLQLQQWRDYLAARWLGRTMQP